MAINRRKAKGRRDYGHYIPIPTTSFLGHPNYHNLSASAVKLLFSLCSQFSGHNNGDFTAAFSVLQKQGWKSKETLQRAKQELLEKGFIVETRKGGLGMGCSLYGVTFLPINHCKGKLDTNFSESIPLGWWKNGQPP